MTTEMAEVVENHMYNAMDHFTKMLLIWYGGARGGDKKEWFGVPRDFEVEPKPLKRSGWMHMSM